MGRAKLVWRKSTFSTPTECVELAWPGDAAAVRDSKNPASPVLIFEREPFSRFVARLGR